MPVFTISFCAVLAIVYILDSLILIPRGEAVTAKEKLLTGHNKGYICRALHLSCTKIKKGEVWRLVSSCLLHIGLPHIVTNTAAMLIAGYAVESELGALRALICYAFSVLVSGIYMAFVYKLEEGEGASTGIFGMIAVFILLAFKNGTVMFSPLPFYALIILGIYIITGFTGGKTTLFEHLSGFAGGLIAGAVIIYCNL